MCDLAEGKEIPKRKGGNEISIHTSHIFQGFRFIIRGAKINPFKYGQHIHMHFFVLIYITCGINS
jgi:hypothetical protein